MKLPMVVSPTTWDLIDRLRPDLDVIVDVFDATLAPLLPDGSHPQAQALRAAMEDRRPEAGRDRLGAALRTGRHSLFTSEALRVGLFPVRYHRDAIGVLAVSSPVARTPGAPPSDASIDAIDRRLERIGWTLRAALEADIALWEKLDRAEHRARWADGVLRFLAYLHTCQTEADLFASVVQAAAVWGDFDARVYRRTLDRRYVMEASLPAVGRLKGPETFDAASFADQRGPVRITSIAELEQMGWKVDSGEMTFLPIGGALPSGSWLLAIGGVADAWLSAAFETLAHTVAVRLDALLHARAEGLVGRLRGALEPPLPSPAATAATLFRELASALPASQVRVLERVGEGALRPLASVGATLFGDSIDLAPEGRLSSPERLILPLRVGAVAPALLELTSPVGHPFSLADAWSAERAAGWLEAWLAGAWLGLGGTRAPVPGYSTLDVRLSAHDETAGSNGW